MLASRTFSTACRPIRCTPAAIETTASSLRWYQAEFAVLSSDWASVGSRSKSFTRSPTLDIGLRLTASACWAAKGIWRITPPSGS